MTESPEVYPDFPDDDQDESTEADEQGVEGLADEPPRTGNPRVDGVLGSLTDLADRPVGEHAAVFERAHEELRAALEPDRESA